MQIGPYYAQVSIYTKLWRLDAFELKNNDYIKKLFKQCSELNFLQKSQWVHMSTSPETELGASKICVLYISQYSEMRKFTLQLKAAKLPIITKNTSNKSCSQLNFLQKSQQAQMSISPRSGTRERQRFDVWNIVMFWNEKIHFRGERSQNYGL